MIFNRFDASRCAFPTPRLAPLPDRPTLALHQPCPSPAKERDRIHHFARGRYALAAAYRLSGVGPSGALLAPAYHCVTMLDPALALDAPVILYPLHADLSPDLERLDALLEASRIPVKALLATHFFGLPRDFSQLRAWCDARGISLVEDCSHVLCTPAHQAAGTGMYGRYVIASPYKFFACEDGGMLYSPHAPLPDAILTRPAGLIAELRGVKHQFVRLRRTHPSVADIDALDAQLAALQCHSAPEGEDYVVERRQPSTQYTDGLAQSAPLRASRALVACASYAHNVRARRQNYDTWSRALAGLAHGRVLYPQLPDGAVPYMFPLYLDYPSPHFYRLKHLGVPLYRWDEMAVSDCHVAGDYRLHLVHLPCHQALTAADMAWLTAAVRRTLSATPGEGRR